MAKPYSSRFLRQEDKGKRTRSRHPLQKQGREPDAPGEENTQLYHTRI
jgi:hypothetical protein